MNLRLHSHHYFHFKKENNGSDGGFCNTQKSPERNSFHIMQLVLLLIFFYTVTGSTNAQTIRYVKAGATGSGTSWTDDSGDLQAAINASVAGDQVWVARGTYKPKYRADNMSSANANDRNNAFVLKKDVKIYGGFAGTETTLAQRDLSVLANRALLSGDIGATGDNSDNAYHVVISAGDAGTSELNGFTVSGGNADGIGGISINSQVLSNSLGGGIYNSQSSPILNNLIIKGNSTSTGGGGIFNLSSSAVLNNIVISGNTASFGGGIENFQSTTFLTNVTISGNTASSGGGIQNYSSSPTIHNTIIYGNSSGINNSDVNSIPMIGYSLVQGSADVTNGNIDGSADPKFVSPVTAGLNTGGDYHLQPGSPVINAGNNTYYNAGQMPDLSAITTDLAGNPRISGVNIDMGAYEYHQPVKWFVKPGSLDAGISWSEAGDFQTVIDKADNGDSVFVAKGTYQPASGYQFIMRPGVKIYGGFAGTESSLSQRDLSAGNASILKGNGSRVINGGIAVKRDAVLDGFTITGGNAGFFYGGGMYNHAVSPTIANCTFVGNSATRGGGMYNESSAPNIINCIFTDNTATGFGGAMCNISTRPSLMITNCTFFNNNGAGFGGGIFNLYYAQNSIITNCVFWDNTAPADQPDFIYRQGDGTPVFNYNYTQSDFTSIGTGNITGSSDPFINSSNPAGTDGIFGTADDGLRLIAGSATVNAGDPQTNSTNYTVQAGNTDITGAARIQDGIIDMGAYESAVPVAGTISGAGIVCPGSNSTTLTLTGYAGNIQWQSSTDNVTFNNIEGANAATYTASNLTATTWYQAVVSSGTESVTSPGVALTLDVLPAITVTSSNPHLYFGAPGDQTSTITATATGGAAPYTITFSINRALISDYINDAGDEVWSAPGSTTTSANPPSVFTGIADGGSASINVALLADADITATVTDANGCSLAATAVHIVAEDARCFAGKSGNAKVLMCHLTGSAKNPYVEICVDADAVQEHLDEGDMLGSCSMSSRDMGNGIFNSTVNPASAIAPETSNKEENRGKLSVKVMPNPSSNFFTLGLESQSMEKVQLTISDITGRIVERRANVPANSTLQLGSGYHSGIYIAEFVQGGDKVTIRLIKAGK
ncbi:MAG: T9SS type A sorting domain-containing protein [Chitinophagaceae bacterium]|nr:T9SS type A sorting domain-containing protein [Chitinophagaceae bacterium]